jgi:biotin transport system substrate-specific component
MEEISYPQGAPAVLHTSRIAWNTAMAVVLSTALLAICAHIAVPLGFTPVPVTMQTFAVLLLGLLFAPRPAFACMALYLVEGAVGLPVFSPHGPGGLAQLLGPSGGYLLAYPFAAPLASWLYRRGNRGFVAAIAASGLASLLILGIGASWLGFISHAQFPVVFFQSIVPFLPGDTVKVLAAAGCASLLGSFGDASRNPTR